MLASLAVNIYRYKVEALMSNSPLVFKKRKMPAESETPATTLSPEEADQYREEVLTVIQSLLGKILRYPEGAKVTLKVGPQTTIFVLVVDPRDFGILIGKSGVTIESLRVIVRAMMARGAMRGIVQIDEVLESACFIANK